MLPHLTASPSAVGGLAGIRQWLHEGHGVVLIGVCGLPGAGKTTLCRTLIAQSDEDPLLRGRVFHLPCDPFARWGYAERQALIAEAVALADPARIAAVENPRHWYYWEAILTVWKALRTTRRFRYSRAWEPRTGELTATFEMALSPEGPVVVLCDGIHLLHSPVREALDDCWHLRTPVEVTIARAHQRGGWSAEKERILRTYTVPYFVNP